MKFSTVCLCLAAATLMVTVPLRTGRAADTTSAADARTEMARASLMLRAGKKNEALAAMHALFPKGPPDGPLALDYYRIVGGTPGGWSEARTGLERLTRLDPNNGPYRAVLGAVLAAREATQLEAFRILSVMVMRTDIDRQQVLENWESALLSRKPNPADISLYEDYLVADPQNKDIRARLASLQKARTQQIVRATDPVQVARQRGLALLDEGKTDAAAEILSTLQDQLPRDPQVIGGLGLVRLRQGRHAEAGALFEKALVLDPDNAGKWKSLGTTARYWTLMREAGAAREQRDLSAAQAKANAAFQLDPTNAEGVALLASIALDRGAPAQAESLYRKALEMESDNGAAVRGLTALLAAQKRRIEALDVLSRQGTDATRVGGRFTYLRVGILRDEADELVKAQHMDRGMALLEDALILAPDNPWVRFDLASLLLDSAPARARELIEEGLKISPRDSQMLYASALFFARAGAPDDALRSLEPIAPTEFSPSMLVLQQRMRVRSALERAVRMDKAGQTEQASALLEEAAAFAGTDPEFLYSVANAWMARDKPMIGIDVVRRVVAGQDRPSVELKLQLASLLNRAQQDAELSGLVKELNATSGLTAEERTEVSKLELLLAMRTAYAYLRDGDTSKARSLAEHIRSADPNDSRVLLLLGKVAREERNFNEALEWFQRVRSSEMAASQTSTQPSEAEEEIARIERRRQAQVATGLDIRRTPGTRGVSDLATTEVPVEARFPIGYDGHALVHIDTIAMNAGELDLADSYSLTRFGKIQAMPTGDLSNAKPQEAAGTALALGYESDYWRVDLGTTPLGFPVQDLVGGVKWSGSGAYYNYAIDVARRPVTSSLLSYAGTADPVTGEVWGGVRSTGIDMRLSMEKDTLDASVNFGFHVLDGRNVMTNTQFEMRPELRWSLLQDADSKLSTGVVYTYWKFQEDLSYYTFGHGGYYSPQSYHSLTLPLRWSGHRGTFSYALNGSISASWTSTKDMPYYPTRAELQTLAGNPIHTGGDSFGTGFTLAGAVEYPVASQVTLGGRFEMGRSAYYTPNSLVLYLRYSFEPVRDANASAPSAPRAHARY